MAEPIKTAADLVDWLFTNGAGDEGDLLKLIRREMGGDVTYLYGFSRSAVLAKVEEHANAVLVAERQRLKKLLRGMVCTCGHHCPSLSDRVNNPDITCVHQDWCANSKES